MMSNVYRILSLDAGGVKGITSATIIKYIEQKTGKSANELFNVIAGTSIGSFLGASLCAPKQQGSTQPRHSAASFIETFRKHKDKLFQNKWDPSNLPTSPYPSLPTRLPKTPLGLPHEVPGFDVMTLLTMPTPLYREDGIEAFASDLVGQSGMDSALTNLLIASYEIERGEPFNFGNKGQHSSYQMRDAILASGAVPGYFRIYELPASKDEDSFKSEYSKTTLYLVDGGIYAMNPALLGLSELRRQIEGSGAPQLDTLVISVGVGKKKPKGPFVNHESVQSGTVGVSWLVPTFQLIFEGMFDLVDITSSDLGTKDFSKTKYFRIQPELITASAKFDEVSDDNIRNLISDAEQTINGIRAELDALCDVLSQPKPVTNS